MNDAVIAFLERHDFGGAALAPVGGGGRHRVFAVEDGPRRAALKVYEPPAAGRDAFSRDMAVHDLLAAHLPDSIAQVMARDATARCVLFGWVEGGRIDRSVIDASAAREMGAFAAAINSPEVRTGARALGLPSASDAAFSMAGHRRIARERLDALHAAAPPGRLGADLAEFVADELRPALEGLDLATPGDEEIPESDHILSPSDFGFHNVIVRPGGAFVFIDFEHAGWDDPAKMAADFILQPECPLDASTTDAFLDSMATSGLFPNSLRPRVAELLPVQTVKWTSIILNVFTRPGQPAEALEARLEKARRYWESRRP